MNKILVLLFLRLLNDSKSLDARVLVPLSPCKELSNVPWAFWSNNSIILMPQTKSIASALSINFNSRIYFLDFDQKLFEIFKYSPQDQNYVQQEVGLTNSTNFLNTATYIWDRRNDLSSIHVNIIFVDYPPFSIKQNDPSVVKGYHGEMFHSLQQTLQFSYDAFVQEDQVWGDLKNGTYDGMMGEIQHGNMNWGVSDFTVTIERSLVFDFSIPILSLPKRILTRRPVEEIKTSSYFAVFNQDFWICLFISAVVLSFFTYWILRFALNCISTIIRNF